MTSRVASNNVKYEYMYIYMYAVEVFTGKKRAFR